jgi:hypothetical protein
MKCMAGHKTHMMAFVVSTGTLTAGSATEEYAFKIYKPLYVLPFNLHTLNIFACNFHLYSHVILSFLSAIYNKNFEISGIVQP